jgi:DNA repair protein SbcC/Rad50
MAFKQARHTLIEQVADLAVRLANKTKVDLNDLQNELATLKLIYEKALQEVNQSNDYKKAASNLITNILASSKKAIAKEQEFNQITDLYDVIRGQNSLKISFERYLQIEYLEQIIVSANERLKNLSNGQFHLIRSERQESRGKQSGLGLDVYDAYTGQTRDVKTLSGGEKFNASLCLALGMADVIQSFQGNVSIDTMFIDEGFGSLDEESLNKSIDTLIDLQKSGRMIGVISHVQELKTAIPAILEVTKLKEGYSETRFIIK